jgi:hypothetical protein
LVAVAGQPDAATSLGTVKTSSKLTKVTGTSSNYTVPTVNAVLDKLDEIVPDVTGIDPIYTHIDGTHVSVGLYYITEFSNGVHLTTLISDGHSHLMAEAKTADQNQIGTVQTVSELVIVTGAASAYTVPTVNAVSKAIAEISIPDPEGYGYVKYTEVNTTDWNGVRLVTGTKTLSAYGSPVQTVTNSSGLNGSFGVVQTINTIPTAKLTSSATYKTAAGANAGIATAGDKCIVPTVNAVVTRIGEISTIFASYVSAITGTAPIYVTSTGTSYTVKLAIDSTINGGIRVSTVTAGGSTYLVASAQQPNAGANLGTVKTVSEIIKITAASSNYVVPTVNAVSYAIASAIYAMPLATETTYGAVTLSQISGIVSNQVEDATYAEFTSVVDMLSNYVPWPAVKSVDDIVAGQYTFGGDTYIYKPNNTDNPTAWSIYTYNEITDGVGWQKSSNKTVDNFGTVVTHSRIERINDTVTEHMPVIPGVDTTGLTFAGNPGDTFVVPTMNAVYDALMELSRKIPEVISKEIYVISEVSVESYVYDYHTEVTAVSEFYNTYTSEFHYEVSNFYHSDVTYFITSNFYASISAFSGLYGSTAEDEKTIYVSGLPATTTSYGMTIITETVVSLANNVASRLYVVPNTNAVWAAIDGATTAMAEIYVPYTNIDSATHNGVQLAVNNSVISAYAKPVLTAGLTAEPGVVRTVSKFTGFVTGNGTYTGPDGVASTVANYGDKFIVPTVNAVVSHTSEISSSLNSKIDIASNGLVRLIGENIFNISQALVNGLLTVSRAVELDITTQVGTLSNSVYADLGGYLTGLTGTAPISTGKDGQNGTIKLNYGTTYSNGVKLQLNGVNLEAIAQTANEGAAVGTVKTTNTIAAITNASSKYTVPTVNAVSKAIADSIIDPETYGYIKYAEVEESALVGLWHGVEDHQVIGAGVVNFQHFLASAEQQHCGNSNDGMYMFSHILLLS